MNKLTGVLRNVDHGLFKWAVELPINQKHKLLPTLFFYISKSADGYLYLILACVLFQFDKQHGVLFFYTALLAYTIEIPIYIVLKNVFKRQRPCDVSFNLNAFIIPADKFSLPSGHTAAAFLIATIVSYFYPSMAFIIFSWASLVGCSRVVLRVHYPSDVLIGATLGTSIAIISISLLG